MTQGIICCRMQEGEGETVWLIEIMGKFLSKKIYDL
jgi:hypothetical protein